MATSLRERGLTPPDQREKQLLRRLNRTSTSSPTKSSKRWLQATNSLSNRQETRDQDMERRTKSLRGSSQPAKSPLSKWMWKAQSKSTDKHSKETSCSSIHPPLKSYAKESEIELRQRQISKFAFKKQFAKSRWPTTQFSSQTD